ncbi:haloalkane dehalogenase [Alteromonas oceanisediminis]|uniref:haloalkane dehalogenase n=1 Tax=Alteromonas oceanisediminis TaxID=2836180 RepID=UPI001BDA713D|nr:haloalkane dehalogenase [Alteromonas oceanisediminis]MBT0588203.1 haloalkane dehalogenase [Alteromonas oceanisediminis]
MKALRTPDERFENLPDYDFTPHYVTVDDFEGGTLRMHYLDEGPKDGEIVWMQHGEPSWSFLYRKMIKPIADAGYRVIVPDLIGFGKSDKPTQRKDYTYQRHIDWLNQLLDQLKLQNITLVCQDWGGLLGLRMVGEQPQRFARVVAANTMLPTGDHQPPDAFYKWKAFSQEVPVFPAAGIIKGATVLPLTEQIYAAYDAPYPDESYKAGAREFPALVPVTPDDPASPANRKAWQGLQSFDKPFLCAFSDSDPVTAGGDAIMRKLIPGCQGQPHTTIKQGGHFLQEDQGPAFADVIMSFLTSNPLRGAQ